MEGLSLSVLANILAIAVGLVGRQFNPFIEKQQEFRQRAKLLQRSLVEKVSLRNTVLLQHVRDITDFDNELRGDGRESPDLVGELSSDTFRFMEIYIGINTWLDIIRRCYAMLMILTAIPIVLIIVSVLYEPARIWILYIGIILVCIQILLVTLLTLASTKLDQYEKFN